MSNIIKNIYAKDVNGKLFRVDEIIEKNEINNTFFCPTCNGNMLIRKGNINVHHWAHKKGCCKDTWAHGKMTPWHLSWQLACIRNAVEVVIEKNNNDLDNQKEKKIKHRADIIGNNGIIIELQHSSINPEDIKKREEFYDNMIWVFDVSTKLKQFEFQRLGNFVLFKWDHPWITLRNVTKPLFVDFGFVDSILEINQLAENGPNGIGKFVPFQIFLNIYLSNVLENKSNIFQWRKVIGIEKIPRQPTCYCGLPRKEQNIIELFKLKNKKEQNHNENKFDNNNYPICPIYNPLLKVYLCNMKKNDLPIYEKEPNDIMIEELKKNWIKETKNNKQENNFFEIIKKIDFTNLLEEWKEKETELRLDKKRKRIKEIEQIKNKKQKKEITRIVLEENVKKQLQNKIEFNFKYFPQDCKNACDKMVSEFINFKSKINTNSIYKNNFLKNKYIRKRKRNFIKLVIFPKKKKHFLILYLYNNLKRNWIFDINTHTIFYNIKEDMSINNNIFDFLINNKKYFINLKWIWYLQSFHKWIDKMYI